MLSLNTICFAAVAQLKAAAKAKQIVLRDSILNLAIELAVAKLK